MTLHDSLPPHALCTPLVLYWYVPLEDSPLVGNYVPEVTP